MLTQTDGKGNITGYEYNTANILTKKTNPGGEGNPAKTETYTYYADGSLKSKTDRNGKTTQYIYDVHGRMLSQSIGSNTISYTYDNNGNQLTMTDTTGTTIRTYDGEKRVTSKTVPGFCSTVFTYDIVQGQQLGCDAETVADAKGNISTKVYGKAGRLSVGGKINFPTFPFIKLCMWFSRTQLFDILLPSAFTKLQAFVIRSRILSFEPSIFRNNAFCSVSCSYTTE
jgi:Rhs family protein